MVVDRAKITTLSLFYLHTSKQVHLKRELVFPVYASAIFLKRRTDFKRLLCVYVFVGLVQLSVATNTSFENTRFVICSPITGPLPVYLSVTPI